MSFLRASKSSAYQFWPGARRLDIGYRQTTGQSGRFGSRRSLRYFAIRALKACIFSSKAGVPGASFSSASSVAAYSWSLVVYSLRSVIESQLKVGVRMSGPRAVARRLAKASAFCRSGVSSMKPRSAFGVTMLKRRSWVPGVARISRTSSARAVLAAMRADLLRSSQAEYSTRKKRWRTWRPSVGRISGGVCIFRIWKNF